MDEQYRVMFSIKDMSLNSFEYICVPRKEKGEEKLRVSEREKEEESRGLRENSRFCCFEG